MGTIESSKSVIKGLAEISSFWHLVQNPDVPKMGNFFIAELGRYPILKICLTRCSLPLRKLSFGSTLFMREDLRWEKVFLVLASEIWTINASSTSSNTVSDKNLCFSRRSCPNKHSPGQLNQNIDSPKNKKVLMVLKASVLEIITPSFCRFQFFHEGLNQRIDVWGKGLVEEKLRFHPCIKNWVVPQIKKCLQLWVINTSEL